MRHHHSAGEDAASAPGAVIRWPRRYDLLLAVALAGRGPRLRAQIAALLDLQPGGRVLDVGCGTGTLTIALAAHVGEDGRATGIDASTEMIAAASAKAKRRSVPVNFQVATAQKLPFPDDSYDAVVTTLMVHHLPPSDRLPAIRELVRVLRPDGRLLLADFQPPTKPLSRRLARHLIGHGMAKSDLPALLDIANTAGATEMRYTPTPVGWVGMVHGRKPKASASR